MAAQIPAGQEQADDKRQTLLSSDPDQAARAAEAWSSMGIRWSRKRSMVKPRPIRLSST